MTFINWFWWVEAERVESSDKGFQTVRRLSSLNQTPQELTKRRLNSWWISIGLKLFEVTIVWWGLDPHSRIGKWCCRRGELDNHIADLDTWVLVRGRRRIDVARWDWEGDILPLEGCLYPRCGRIWWMYVARWRGQLHMDWMDGSCRDGQGTAWHDGFGSSTPLPSDTGHNWLACTPSKTWNRKFWSENFVRSNYPLLI